MCQCLPGSHQPSDRHIHYIRVRVFPLARVRIMRTRVRVFVCVINLSDYSDNTHTLALQSCYYIFLYLAIFN
jgi:hypothetical protein